MSKQRKTDKLRDKYNRQRRALEAFELRHGSNNKAVVRMADETMTTVALYIAAEAEEICDYTEQALAKALAYEQNMKHGAGH